MESKYCSQCGSKAIKKEIGDEGAIPFCPQCNTPLWDTFTTCIIAAVVNEYNEVALLKQEYVSKTKYVCVAGIMKPGETAEKTVTREIKEEIGQEVTDLQYVESYFYKKKDMLMLGFKASVKKKDIEISDEVDSAEWFSLEEAPNYLREGGIGWQLVKKINNKK